MYDVIVIGGSYAGLSAAMSLGRSLRKTLVIDAGEPCNKQTPNSHNFLTQDGKPPSEIALLGKTQVSSYAHVHFVDGYAVSAKINGSGFTVSLSSGEVFEAKKIILATGIKDEMAEIAGFRECWGISVIHCPYCHGYEYRDKKVGILAPPERAFHLTPLLLNLGNSVTIVQVEPASFTKEQLKTLHRHNVKVINQKVVSINHQNGYMLNVQFDNGKELSLSAMYAAHPFKQASTIPLDLGCELDKQGYIKTDHFQKTSIDGVFACGDNCISMRAVAQAVASGNIAGAVANVELSQESFTPIS